MGRGPADGMSGLGERKKEGARCGLSMSSFPEMNVNIVYCKQTLTDRNHKEKSL